jgi:hypothetical protein
MEFCAGPVMLFFSKELMSLYQNKIKYVGCVKVQAYIRITPRLTKENVQVANKYKKFIL